MRSRALKAPKEDLSGTVFILSRGYALVEVSQLLTESISAMAHGCTFMRIMSDSQRGSMTGLKAGQMS
jgi:hypothetical protein